MVGFRQIQPESIVFYVLDRKECILDKKSKVLKKSKKSNFSKGVSPCFFANNGHFLRWWYLRQSSQKRSSFEILDRKEWFLDKKSQVLRFFVKNGHFGCFWANLARKHRLFYILDKKERFLDKKCQVLKKSKKVQIFQRFFHGFGPKLAIFPSFYFSQYRPGKICFTISQNERTPFQAIKTRRSKRGKIEIFPKGFVHSFWQKMANFFFIGGIWANPARKDPLLKFWIQKKGF